MRALSVQFWFEYASTYSYPAAMRIEALAREAELEIEWRPFLLGPLFKSQQGMDTSPFVLVPSKGAYMWRDLNRICEQHGLTLKPPVKFPQNGVLAARVTLTLPQEQRGAFAKAIYLANFAESRDISTPETISACLAGVGLDPEAALAAAATDKIKAQLRADTQLAADRGVFGSPNIITLNSELFWGNDRIEDALAWAKRGTLRPAEQT